MTLQYYRIVSTFNMTRCCFVQTLVCLIFIKSLLLLSKEVLDPGKLVQMFTFVIIVKSSPNLIYPLKNYTHPLPLPMTSDVTDDAMVSVCDMTH